jgi:hypothetical protein
MNRRVNSRPMFIKKFLAFALEQHIARADFDEHSETAPLLDQLLVDQFLISLQNGERIDPVLGRDIAHRRQRIAFVEHAVEYHVHDAIAKLAINWLTIVPFTVHDLPNVPVSLGESDPRRCFRSVIGSHIVF